MGGLADLVNCETIPALPTIMAGPHCTVFAIVLTVTHQAEHRDVEDVLGLKKRLYGRTLLGRTYGLSLRNKIMSLYNRHYEPSIQAIQHFT